MRIVPALVAVKKQFNVPVFVSIITAGLGVGMLYSIAAAQNGLSGLEARAMQQAAQNAEDKHRREDAPAQNSPNSVKSVCDKYAQSARDIARIRDSGGIPEYGAGTADKETEQEVADIYASKLSPNQIYAQYAKACREDHQGKAVAPNTTDCAQAAQGMAFVATLRDSGTPVDKAIGIVQAQAIRNNITGPERLGLARTVVIQIYESSASAASISASYYDLCTEHPSSKWNVPH